LGLFYKIYPSVYWLLGIQAICLSLGALPLWHLARNAGLKEIQATTLAGVYLLYPLIFNLNLFDFHPEVMALPAFFGAILAARTGKIAWFAVAIIFILGCKDALSLTVAMMGFWLLVFEKKRLCGAIALTIGVAWFIIVTQVVIPHFSGEEVAAIERYHFLGNSLEEIILNLFLKPGIVLQRILIWDNLEYLIKLLFPLVWGLSPGYLTPLIAAIPALALNLITDQSAQKDLVHQYSLPILPFLLLSVIATMVAQKEILKKNKYILLWSLISFVLLAKYFHFISTYVDNLDTWGATRSAITQVQPSGGVFTTSEIAPHLTHRSIVQVAYDGTELTDLNPFNYVLFNVRYPGDGSSQKTLTQIIQRVETMPEFRLVSQQDDVFLFERIKPSRGTNHD
jgi:uncharacterized membrane protein